MRFLTQTRFRATVEVRRGEAKHTLLRKLTNLNYRSSLLIILSDGRHITIVTQCYDNKQPDQQQQTKFASMFALTTQQ